ncbi:MAG: oxaloacetate decarboxylase [Synergistaceae bacterium]|jgi:methylisocitrate lyase|nr:oxaloacetate decarboxylase [Synergistaceae bacterium]
MKTEKRSTALRRRLAEPGILTVPGVYDSLSARICEMAGFEAVFHSGYGTAASRLCMPDVGLLSLTEMAASVRSISRAVGIPVLSDADNGFGNAVNVVRTVEEYVTSGAAGLFIEDQAMPKRCGHMSGKSVIPWPEMDGKLRAALETRDELDPDFLIMCRIDSLAVNGFDDALGRAKSAVGTGADLIFIEALETTDQMRQACSEVKAPMMLNLIEGGRTPLVSYDEAEEMGFRLVVPALTALYAAARGMYDIMRRVRTEGVSLNYKDRLFDFKEFAEIVRLDKIEEMERRYLPEEDLSERYGGGRNRIV